MAGFRVQTMNLINSSWGMRNLNEYAVEAALALAAELSGQRGMAGDDDAGQTFSQLYLPAARTTVNQFGEAASIIAAGSTSLLKTATNYLAAESEVSAAMLGSMPEAGAAPAGPDCNTVPTGQGEELPEVVDETGFVEQYIAGRRYRGDSGKLRTVAATWRKAQRVAERILSDAQDCWAQATREFEGDAADGVKRFFTTFVGARSAPSHPGPDHTLLANLPAACFALANACDQYADHIDKALPEIMAREFDLLHIEAPWDSPKFGGNGYDAGLHTAVAGDTRITGIGDVAHALDDSQQKVKVPRPEPDLPVPGVPPMLPAPVGPPVLVPLGYKPVDPGIPRKQPVPPPTPPDPRFPALSPAERAQFDAWSNSLRDSGIAGGNPDEQAYQMRIAGYPEKEIPIDPSLSKEGTILADGVRSSDGMAVDAKYVKEPGCGKTFRTLDKLQKAQKNKNTFLFKSDDEELKKYKSAMEWPPNNGQLRGLEIVTNDPDSVAYWNAVLAANQVNGYARYHA
ncbi:hypothetical protein GCM10010406_35160 [Streptomyces thermolineatus]|uniref:Tox-REase-2 domain-containing protein n=1 Tax=Streptomyces thermolineatus TaxID=44033 RepID=A0ABP5ZF57_9ACTN